MVPLLGLYVSGAVTLSINKLAVAEAPAQKTRLYAILLLSFTVATELDDVELPNKSPENSLHARRLVDGLYDNGVTELSIYRAFPVAVVVLLNGMKYAPFVLSAVKLTPTAVVELLIDPLNVVAVMLPNAGLHDILAVFCGCPYPVAELSLKLR